MAGGFTDLQNIAEEKKALGVAQRSRGLELSIASFGNSASPTTEEVLARSEAFIGYIRGDAPKKLI